MAILGLGLSSAAGAVWLIFGATDREALTQMPSVLLVGLQDEDYDKALAVCAEGEPGAQMLAGEDRQVFVPAAGSTEGRAANARNVRIESLTILRQQLAQLGVQWSDITPIAFGGVRAAMTLRAMLAEMGTSSIPSLLPIPKVQNAFEEDGTPADENYPRRAGKFLDELEWYAYAMKTARATPCERSECDTQV